LVFWAGRFGKLAKEGFGWHLGFLGSKILGPNWGLRERDIRILGFKAGIIFFSIFTWVWLRV